MEEGPFPTSERSDRGWSITGSRLHVVYLTFFNLFITIPITYTTLLARHW